MNLDKAIVVALGANLPGAFGDVRQALEAAIEALDEAGLKVVRRSGWWRSAAWPDPSEPPYVNGVVLIETDQPVEQVHAALQAIEARFGRVRTATNAARTLDLDLIAHGRLTTDGEGLTVPHPRAAERLFVMGPLAQIVPDWRHPVSGASAKTLAEQATVGVDAQPIDAADRLS